MDMTVAELQGYVKGSTVHIWTTEVDFETINIVHIHVNDTSEYVSFDTAYVHEGEDISNFMQFKTDMTGKPLKYKILVKDNKVWKVLYNDESSQKEVSQLPFKQIELAVGELYLTKQSQGQRYLSQIDSIPTGTVVCADFNKM